MCIMVTIMHIMVTIMHTMITIMYIMVTIMIIIAVTTPLHSSLIMKLSKNPILLALILFFSCKNSSATFTNLLFSILPLSNQSASTSNVLNT